MSPSIPFCSMRRSHSETGALKTLFVNPSQFVHSGDMRVTLIIAFSFQRVVGLMR